MARQITVELVGDTGDFERAMRRSGAEIVELESDLKSADTAAGRFEQSVGNVSSKLEGSSQRFRDTADLAGGLGDLLGIEVLGQVNMYATAVADMADGMAGLLGPALKKSQVLFKALNMTMLSNPIFLVVAALAALTAAFIIAYKKSETFRRIVHAAMDGVKRATRAMVDGVVDAVQWAGKKLGALADLITTPYRNAFRAIAWLWNNTVGRLSFSIPGWVPGVGGNGFDVPDIPMLAKGGTAHGGRPHIVGEQGPELFIPRMTGTVVPNGVGGGNVQVIISTGASDLDELIRRRVRIVGGGNVQKAFGQ